MNVYTWDEYRLRREWRNMLETDIRNNWNAWITAAKTVEEIKTPVDTWQLRADIDYVQFLLQAMTAPMLLAANTEPTSDAGVLELAWRYYPTRWDKNRLKRLVYLQQLMQEDYKAITGEDFVA